MFSGLRAARGPVGKELGKVACRAREPGVNGPSAQSPKGTASSFSRQILSRRQSGVLGTLQTPRGWDQATLQVLGDFLGQVTLEPGKAVTKEQSGEGQQEGA